jgi:hypothetical protein
VLLILVDLEAHAWMALASTAVSVLLDAKVSAVKKVSIQFEDILYLTHKTISMDIIVSAIQISALSWHSMDY